MGKFTFEMGVTIDKLIDMNKWATASRFGGDVALAFTPAYKEIGK